MVKAVTLLLLQPGAYGQQENESDENLTTSSANSPEPDQLWLVECLHPDVPDLHGYCVWSWCVAWIHEVEKDTEKDFKMDEESQTLPAR